MKKFFLVSAVFMICALFTGCSNLQWSEKATNSMSWDKAKEYCENLDEGGHNDWRLPNIDELRTVIQNCPRTVTGGNCKVSQKNGCLSSECATAKDCLGCDIPSGTNSKLGDTGSFWSSSVIPGKDKAWIVGFPNGVLLSYIMSYDNYVRCVR